MTQPSVTVIVPVYNGERYLAEALRSIVEQGYQPLEVLVVDDGSTDGSVREAARFPAARVLHKAHSGLAATLNHAISHAHGELFAFLDADDRWLPGKLARQVGELQRRPELDLVFSHVRQFASHPDAAGAADVFSAPQPAVCKSTLLIRRTSFLRVGGFSEAADRHDFLDWYARARAADLQAAVLPEVLAERRVHDANLGRTDPARQRRQYLSTLHAVINQRRQSATRS